MAKYDLTEPPDDGTWRQGRWTQLSLRGTTAGLMI